MAKDPACLFYWNDWQGGTVTMTRHQKGCYMDLLHAQFNTGHLSLEQIRAVLGVDFDSNWGAIESKFIRDDAGRFFNEKLENEKERRQKFTKSRAENLASKPEDSSHKGDHMKDHMELHTGDRMEIEIRNRNKNKETGNPKSEISPDVEQIISHLNQITGSSFKNTEGNAKYIRARLKEGYTVQDLQMITVVQNHKWKGTQWESYLRPSTLFNSEKAGGYLSDAKKAMETGIAPAKTGLSKIDERNARIRRESELLDQQRRAKIVNQ